MTSLFYLFINGQQTGPYTIEQLRALWSTGSITADTIYWREGMADWMPVHALLVPQKVTATVHATHTSKVTNRHVVSGQNSSTMKRLPYIGVFLVVLLCFALLPLMEDSLIKGTFALVILIGLIVSTWFRLKDCGWPRTLAFLQLLPFVGILLTIILFFIPSTLKS